MEETEILETETDLERDLVMIAVEATTEREVMVGETEVMETEREAIMETEKDMEKTEDLARETEAITATEKGVISAIEKEAIMETENEAALEIEGVMEEMILEEVQVTEEITIDSLVEGVLKGTETTENRMNEALRDHHMIQIHQEKITQMTQTP